MTISPTSRLRHILTMVCTAVLLCTSASFPMQGKKVSTRHKNTPAHAGKHIPRRPVVHKYDVVFTDTPDHHEKMVMSHVTFSGFDKPASSRKESFFITNNTPDFLHTVKLRLNYMTPSGRQLHSRIVTVNVLVPPGQTRNVTMDAWDRQGSFFYVHSRPQRKGKATPFEVSIHPLKYTFERRDLHMEPHR